MKKFISMTIGGNEEYISGNDITAVDVSNATTTVIYYANGTKMTLTTVTATAAPAIKEWNRVRKQLAQTAWTNVVEEYDLTGAYASITSYVIAAI